MSINVQKRDNAYYLDRLLQEHPDAHADLMAGKHATVDAALRAAGLKKTRSRLMELRNAWKHATADEQNAFKSDIGCIAPPGPVRHPAAHPAAGGPISRDRRLEPWAVGRIREIMSVRGIKNGTVMDEIGFKRLNASLGMALDRGTQLQPTMIDALKLWLETNKHISKSA